MERSRQPLDLDAAHQTAVFTAYGFHPANDLLAQLLTLNQSVAANIGSSHPVTALGLPAAARFHRDFITTNSILPA